MTKGLHQLRRALLLGSMLAPLGAPPTFANPQGGQVVGGSATITGAAGSMVVQQNSIRSVINWQSFSTSAGETVRFNLPSAQAAILNRVTGAQMSSLMGSLSSNGQVYLLNPNGVVVGPNGKVATAGFVASTLDLSNDQFMSGGAQTFKGRSTAGIVILGTVKADGGDVLLAAAQVDNGGRLLSPSGQIILSAGSELIYVPGQTGNITIAAPAPASGAAVSNTGVIAAAHVQLAAAGSAYALAVNNGGQISATGVSNVGGHVVLDGGSGDVVDSGSISASGGAVSLTGGRVALTGGALVDVSAASGGGRATLAATDAIEVDAQAAIKADATARGDGGAISVKAGGATAFAGTVSAVGGAQAGDGGSVEISGGALNFTGAAALLAPKGKTGTLLFDPATIDVVSGNAATPAGVSGGLWAFATDTGAGQTISVGAIESLLASANLELQATSSITFDAPGTGAYATLASNSSKTLTLTAPTIAVNASISLPNGALVFNWPDADITAHGVAQSVSSAASATITAHALTVAGGYDQVALDGPVTAGTLAFTEPSFSASAITIKNPANAISAVSFDPGGSNSAQSVDVESSTAMAVSGDVQNANSVTLAAGGDLTLQSGFIAGAASTTFASTGGVFDNLAGSGAVTGANGMLRIYSSTNGVGASGVAFNDNGLGSTATIASGVSYPSNPNTTDPVVEYFATTSAEPTLTITADSLTRLYGQSDPTFTASYSGGSGHGASELTTLPSFRVLQGVDVNAGAYTIEPYGAASSVDLLRYVDGTLDVNPAPLTITAHAASMTYGGSVPTFGYDIAGFVNGDTAAIVSGVSVTSNAPANPSAGSYVITPSGATVATPAGGAEANYTISYQTAAFSVNPAPLTVTASPASAVYGAAIPGFGLSFSGFVDAADAASVPNQFAAITSATVGSSVGSYPITLANGNPNSNYSVSYVGANLTITPAALTITPNLSRRYGGALPTILPIGDFSGFVAGDTAASLSTQPTETTTAGVGSNVGSYAITASGAADPNYTITYAPGVLNITPAPLLITAQSGSRAYGAANPTFTASYSGLVNGDSSSVVTGLAFSTAATSASNVGNYAIVPSGGSASNYSIRYAFGALTITPVPLSIQPFGTSVYGADPSTTATVAYHIGGFVNGDSQASLTSQPSFTTFATSASHVGLYGLLASGAVDPNYVISYQPGVLTVNPAPVTLTPDAATFTYGSTFSGPLGVTVSGLVNGDTVAKVFASTPTADVSAFAGSHVGVYQTFAQRQNTIDNDYVAVFAPGSLTVTPATLTVTPNAASVTYGSIVSGAIGITASGLVNGDTLAKVFASTPTVNVPDLTGARVGVYQIFVQPQSTIDNDYVVVFTPGSLTVTPAPLTITPNLILEQGQPLPAVLPASAFSGLVNGDTPSSLTTQPQVTVSSAGLASVVTASGAYDPNYVISYSPGQITTLLAMYTPPQPVTGLPLVQTSQITIPPEVFGFTGAAFQEEEHVIQQFIATMAAQGITITDADIMEDLLTNPTSIEGILLPYMMDDLNTILNLPQDQWTADQQAFVQAFQTFIQQQREAAAAQAQADYAAWQAQQEAATAAQLRGLGGPTYAMMSAILASNPPQPPPELIAEINVGISLTTSQALTASDVLGSASDFVTTVSNSGSSGATLSGGAASDVGAVWNLVVAGVGSPKLSNVLPVSVAKSIAPYTQKGGLPSLASRRISFLKLNLEDANETLEDLEAKKANATNQADIDALDKSISKQNVKITSLETQVQDAQKVIDDGGGKLAAEVGEMAGDIIGAGGVVLEVLGDAAQIGMSASQYASIAAYNTTFNQAVATAQQPVSVADLKAMLNTSDGQQQLTNYMTAMMVTGSDHAIAPVSVTPPSAPPPSSIGLSTISSK